jgi:hypothetical protein
MGLIGYAIKDGKYFFYMDDTNLSSLVKMELSNDPGWMSYRKFMEKPLSDTYKTKIILMLASQVCDQII